MKWKKKNDSSEFSRRTALQALAGLGAGFIVWNKSTKAIAQTQSRKPFLLYIHAGSSCGPSSGIVQPPDANIWPRDTFVKGQRSGSVNPNVNLHFKTGDLVFTNYNKFLESMANHMCFTVGTPRTLDHFEAIAYAHRGGRMASSNPAWIAGFAQAALAGGQGTILAVPDHPEAQRVNDRTASVINAPSRNIDEFVKSFSDPATIPTTGNFGVMAESFWQVLVEMNAQQHGGLKLSVGDQLQAADHIQRLKIGIPQLQIGSAIRNGIEQDINLTAVDALINAHVIDKAGTLAARTVREAPLFTVANLFVKQLQLAAGLIKTQAASAMTIGAMGSDYHSGGAAVRTARAGSQMWAHLSVFWDWVKQNNLQNDVMIIVSHEFTRSAYNNSPGPVDSVDVMVGSQSQKINITSPGTDHQMAMGMVFIHGDVPAAGRVGNMVDGNFAAAAANLHGGVDLSEPAYTSTELVGSMLMRCFPAHFNESTVKHYWRDFQRPISVLLD